MTLVSVAQLELAVGQWEAVNRPATVAAVEDAVAAGARLIVLPELSDSGYVFTGPDEARSLAHPVAHSPALALWQSLAAQHSVVIAGGFCELGEDGRLCNSAALVDGSGVRAVYRKAHLWDTEKGIFVPGSGAPPVVKLEFGCVGLMICYDLEFPEWVRLAALAGADLIAAPVNWPKMPWPDGERPPEIIKAQAGAATNGVYIAVADRARDERGVSWVGGSLIAAPDGRMLAGPGGRVLTADCELPRARDKSFGPGNDLFGDRRVELYGGILGR
jgi:predicted amidohydrolase